MSSLSSHSCTTRGITHRGASYTGGVTKEGYRSPIRHRVTEAIREERGDSICEARGYQARNIELLHDYPKVLPHGGPLVTTTLIASEAISLASGEPFPFASMKAITLTVPDLVPLCRVVVACPLTAVARGGLSFLLLPDRHYPG